MTTWVKEHFSDAKQARETIATIALVGSCFAFAMLMFGVYWGH